MATGLDGFEPSKSGRYDPGQVVILFDGRQNKSPEEKYSTLQYYWMQSMIKLGWPSVHAQDLEPGKLRLMWDSRLSTLASLHRQGNVRLFVRAALPAYDSGMVRRESFPNDWRIRAATKAEEIRSKDCDKYERDGQWT
nr:hypothetical protein CFP56_41427 [Quercus suber]